MPLSSGVNMDVSSLSVTLLETFFGMRRFLTGRVSVPSSSGSNMKATCHIHQHQALRDDGCTNLMILLIKELISFLYVCHFDTREGLVW